MADIIDLKNWKILRAQRFDNKKRDRDRSLAERYFSDGLACELVKNESGAIYHYELSIQCFPLPGALVNLGRIEYDKMRFYNARRFFEKAIQIDPRYTLAHYNLGNAFDSLGEFEKAIESYKKTIELNPNYKNAHCNLAIDYQNTGKLMDALRHWYRFSTLSPDGGEDFEIAQRNILFIKGLLLVRKSVT